MSPNRASVAAGTFGGDRTLLVVCGRPELAVALREVLDRSRVTVVETRPGEVVAAVQTCAPWPWMVAGEGSALDPVECHCLAALPVPALWRGQPPPRIEHSARVVAGFAAMARALQRALAADVGGVRLARGSGINLPDGRHVACPPLEALLSAHPAPIRLAPRHVDAANAALLRAGVALRALGARGGATLADVGTG